MPYSVPFFSFSALIYSSTTQVIKEHYFSFKFWGLLNGSLGMVFPLNPQTLTLFKRKEPKTVPGLAASSFSQNKLVLPGLQISADAATFRVTSCSS